ncbi:PTS transporter subunit EIIC [Corynebacterium lowii]|uniref:PTS system glucose-specific EIICB component n=1 Tax=Corynebacterium lowii TaxID=1544413 RepID=A0A0Q1AH38_9CORY|nr:PTS transporter subunit EIIC [Corynebacterium lowii]KQB85981.1 PTS system glucose-specific EIICB component [Corynebacterium lowii]MDP9850589.1 PTS system N-acetylglucosamine-specific IIC component [Corynebacterium lowii]
MSPTKKKGKSMQVLQRLGRSLMLPIATLPVAALMARAGQPDLLGRWPEITVLNWLAHLLGGAGNAIMSNLPILFAVGIAIGFVKKADGSTALAAVVGYLMLTGTFEAMSPLVLDGVTNANGEQAVVNYNVFGGVIIGLIAALEWQRFHRTKLPDWLGFFSGKRLVPMIVGFTAVLIAIPMLLVYPYFDAALTWAGEAAQRNDVLGGFLYGLANRSLIPLGLHHLLNFVPWFVLGSYPNASGTEVHGDIARFLAGDPTAGSFMTGFFPIMMFALPAACLAFYHTARPAQKKIVGGAMFSLALTAFLTGITEPIEFSFMFAAMPLYVLHAVLTGTSLALMNFLGAKMGFGFSAGATDLVLNWGIGTHPWMILVVGLGYGVLYYLLFRFIIVKFNLMTPGRNPEEDPEEAQAEASAEAPEKAARPEDTTAERGSATSS